jgi:hypothetical protein
MFGLNELGLLLLFPVVVLIWATFAVFVLRFALRPIAAQLERMITLLEAGARAPR